MLKPPAEDLDRRRPVWEAMSEYFLDTELTPAHQERIAEVLLRSGYSDADLDAILWQELCPVLGNNLASPAGEWGGFDMNDVEEQILSGTRGRSVAIAHRIARDEWEKVRSIMRSKRPG